jgi:eukaryotic translation initiation factor 2C
MEELVKLHKVSYLGGRLPAYDGRKSMYTAGPLPFTSKEFHITLLDEDDGSGLERSVLEIFFLMILSYRAKHTLLTFFLRGQF